jgi:hypothetical protein
MCEDTKLSYLCTHKSLPLSALRVKCCYAKTNTILADHPGHYDDGGVRNMARLIKNGKECARIATVVLLKIERVCPDCEGKGTMDEMATGRTVRV